MSPHPARLGLLSAVALAAACSTVSCKKHQAEPLSLSSASAASSAEVPDARPAAMAALPPPAELTGKLSEYAVTSDDFARRVVYTWTTTAQVAELRKTRTLLSRGESPTKGSSRFDTTLQADADGTSAAIARALRKPSLSRRRFGWTAPHGTVLGFGGESYGDQLVRVELKPEAVIARYAPGTPSPWAFRDLRGNPVAAGDVVDHPERLGAVYHVARAEPGADAGKVPGPFREYVLCNESMIASWGVSTDAVRAEIDADIASLRALRVSLDKAADEADAAWASRVSGSVWPALAPSSPPRSLYEASLAFATPAYRPSAEHLGSLASALERVRPSIEPLEHVPQASPAASASASVASAEAPKPPAFPRCVPDGSFMNCRPLPPKRRFAHDGRFCVDPVTNNMIDCPKR